MSLKFIFKVSIIIFTFYYNSIQAQTTCSLGDPVFVENFGAGSNRLGPSLNQDPNKNVHPDFRPAGLYNYVGNGNIGPDQYSIMKSPKDAAVGGADWNDDFEDHTPYNIDGGLGYLYYCDAYNDLNVFYAQKIDGLCENIEYELSAWFAKTNAPNYFIDPNIKLIIGFTDINDQKIGNIIETNTGPIEGVGINRWHRKELVFTVPAGTENIYFMLKNNVSGVAGNDLAIDDIEVRPCGPKIDITNQLTNTPINNNNTIQCITSNSDRIISISANIPNNFVMQWQESSGNNIWTDILNETSKTLNYTIPLSSSSTHLIRLKFAHSLSNLTNSNCNFLSEEITYYEWMINNLITLIQCDDEDPTSLGFSSFNLTEANSKILANINNETITYFTTEAAALSGNTLVPEYINNYTSYINKNIPAITNFDTVWARVKSPFECQQIVEIQLFVSATQIPNPNIRLFQCDDNLDTNGNNTINNDNKDGISAFNLNTFPINIPTGLNALPPRYFRNKADALAKINEITEINNYRNIDSPNEQQIYVRIDSAISNDCIGLGPFITLFVNQLPNFSVDSPQIVCSSDPTYTVTLDALEDNPNEVFNYQWFWSNKERTITNQFISNDKTITVSTPGIYSVTLTKTDGTGCSRTKDIFVNASEKANVTLNDITVIDLSDNNTITINATNNNLGLGDYEYALDDMYSSYQEEPFFNHVKAGFHTLFIRDKKGCGITPINISVIGYPKFFTPNGDGNNDFWKIKGVNAQFQKNSIIYIYDRFGKLIKQLTTTSSGWDGTFNGIIMPTDDYWFKVYLEDARTFSGHFTLKR